MRQQKIQVHVRFVPAAEGGRTTPVNLSDGRYRTVAVMGTHLTSPPPAKSESDAERRGVFGIVLADGPSAVSPGESTTATLEVLVWEPGYTRLLDEREFTIIEGHRVVAHGRVLGPISHAV